MIEDVLYPEEPERKSNQKDIVGRIASLNDLKTATKENPPGIHKLPKQSTAKLPDVSQRCASLPGRRVPIDMHTAQQLIPFCVVLPSRAEHRHFVPVLA